MAAQDTRHDRRPASGFTVIELILAIAVIFTLLTVTLVALRSARAASERTRTLGALRQMMTGYTGYTTEHDGRLIPGYVKPATIGTGPNQIALSARLASGHDLTAADTSSYVWRLAPYLDHHWLTYMTDYVSPQMESRFIAEYGDGTAGATEAGNAPTGGAFGPGTINPATQFGIGFLPSIGLNSIYIGGDNFHGNAYSANYNPWQSKTRIAAVRASEVKNPAKLIVFAPTRAVNVDLPASEVQLGYVELRPPFLPGALCVICEQSQWIVDDKNQLRPSGRFFNGIGGVMVDRGGGTNVPSAHFDGSTVVHSPIEFVVDPALTDQNAIMQARERIMSWWAPFIP